MTDWRDFTDDGLTPTLRAARELFARNGYHATSIRAVADAAGLSVPGLYHHHKSKQAILSALVGSAMDRMLAHSRAADADSDGSALGRFDNVMECLLRFHMQRRDDAFVASTEMRSMDDTVLRRHVAQRDEQQRMIAGIIEQGVADGTFRCRHVDDAARAAASLCVALAGWYDPAGSLAPDEVVARQLQIARRIAGVELPRA
ncbi:TetR/AcrR family transcriptional regulator [Tomitella fengzijianii]|uniref:Helix-turn-helix transcriptional regulator n=1 Tax=Tomitella fengzijianii TaxID=2597660 RepID=A0A516X0A2_9ACTN|nr:TetR/AcrR family transcriptional regulator [Tomitella fengzijianii]QDQ96051.1 helix-turn-helix transcriptional regulator [Tomitella fengzijianii]